MTSAGGPSGPPASVARLAENIPEGRPVERSPLRVDSAGTALFDVAEEYHIGIRQVVLAWLLHHANNILVITGTSSVGHLEQNITADHLQLTADETSALDALSAT